MDSKTEPSPSQLLDTEVWKLLNAGKRGQAVTLVRNGKSCSMDEARAYVDYLDSGSAQTVDLRGVPLPSPTTGLHQPVRMAHMLVAIAAALGLVYLVFNRSAGSPPVEPISNGTLSEFSFSAQGNQKIIATTQPSAAGPSAKRLVMFTPFLDRTDGNLYLAALQSLFNLYGKHRGLFQLGDARTKAEPALGGSAICWRVSNPATDYCVFPVKDESTGKVAALTVWLE